MYAPHVLSFINSELGNFQIEPEHLDTDEIKYDHTHVSGVNPPPSIETVNDITPNVQAAASEQIRAENTPNVLPSDNLIAQAIRQTEQNTNNCPVTRQ